MLSSLIDASVILSSFAFDQVRSLEDKSNNLPVLYDDMLNSKLLSGGLPKSEFSTLFSKNFSDTFQKIVRIELYVNSISIYYYIKLMFYLTIIFLAFHSSFITPKNFIIFTYLIIEGYYPSIGCTHIRK